jgi:hypothetical protein
MVSSPKHVAPIIDYDNSDLDDVLMSVTYVSDHDWEKHSTFDIENLFGTNSKHYEVNNCCTISTIHVPSYDDMFDEYASASYDDMLEFLKLYLFCLPMLSALRFHDLSLYKTIFHRKWFRFKCVSNLLFDTLSFFKFLYGAFALSSFLAPT